MRSRLLVMKARECLVIIMERCQHAEIEMWREKECGEGKRAGPAGRCVRCSECFTIPQHTDSMLPPRRREPGNVSHQEFMEYVF